MLSDMFIMNNKPVKIIVLDGKMLNFGGKWVTGGVFT